MERESAKSVLPWLESLKFDPIPVLSEAAPLHIRFQLFRDVLEDLESDTIQAFRKNLRKQKERRLLLSSQSDSGLWPLPSKTGSLKEGQKATLQYLRQVEVLSDLLDLQVTRKQEKALLGMREILRYLDSDHDPLRLHQLSQGIYLSIIFDLDGNPIIKKLIWEILRIQNPDGGWSSLPGEKSCLWTTLHLLWVLGQSEQFKNNRSLSKGLNYLTKGLLKGDQSSVLPGMLPWDTLISGNAGLGTLQGGTLRFLETVKLFKADTRDRADEKLLDWLLSIQLKNSLWPSIVGRDKQGSFEVTLRVLKVVKHFQSLRLIETMRYDD